MGLLSFYAAIIFYTAFSSPTPDYISWAECCVAILLIFSVGVTRGWNAITFPVYPTYLSFHRLFFLFMLSVPLAIGGIAGYAPTDILRDIIPLAFLILPLCFYNKEARYLLPIMMTGGTLFALRYLFPSLLVSHNAEAELLYLANSPLVPLAAIVGFHYTTRTTKSLLITRMLGVLCSLICFAAMAAMIQRAPLALSLLGCLALLLLRAPLRPISFLLIMAIGTAFLLSIKPFLQDILTLLMDKTLSVGWNNRIEEWQAVFGHLTFWGEGWGSIWQSPAVADIWVRYTHNFLSYSFLKAGVIGGLLTIAFIYLWGRQCIIMIRHNPAIGLAVFIPFAIHVTLYTGFKTLDFAMILTLLTVRPWHQTRNPS